jgi:hypothetical protein
MLLQKLIAPAKRLLEGDLAFPGFGSQIIFK